MKTLVLLSMFMVQMNMNPVPPYSLPAFPGGAEALQAYIAQNLEYPEEARVQAIEGSVVVKLVIDEAGQIYFSQVMESDHPLLEAPALKVFENMPNWKPGEKDGVPTEMHFQLPIRLKGAEIKQFY